MPLLSVCALVLMQATESIGCPRSGGRAVCELPGLGARNRTWVLSMNSKHAWLLNHLSSPWRDIFSWNLFCSGPWLVELWSIISKNAQKLKIFLLRASYYYPEDFSCSLELWKYGDLLKLIIFIRSIDLLAATHYLWNLIHIMIISWCVMNMQFKIEKVNCIVLGVRYCAKAVKENVEAFVNYNSGCIWERREAVRWD